MKRVTGNFQTRFGVARFSMTNAKAAVLIIDGAWTVRRVEYHGKLEVRELNPNEPSDFYGAYRRWMEKSGLAYIHRVDKKDIDYKSTTFNDIKFALLQGWVEYINHPHNAGVLVMAAKVNLDNEREGYVSDLTKAENAVKLAQTALEQWDEKRGPLHAALKQGLDGTRYDQRFVKIIED